MTRIIYVVYTKEYLTSWQITGANLKKYAFLCDYSEVKDVVKVNNSYSKVVKKNTNGSLSCLSYSGYMQNKKEIDESYVYDGYDGQRWK